MSPRAGYYGRRLGRLLAEHKALVGTIFGASILINLCGLAAPRFTQEILDRVIPSGDASFLAGLVLILTLVVVVFGHEVFQEYVQITGVIGVAVHECLSVMSVRFVVLRRDFSELRLALWLEPRRPRPRQHDTRWP